MTRLHRHDQASIDDAVKIAVEITARFLVDLLTEVGRGIGEMDPLVALRETIKKRQGQLTGVLALAGVAGGVAAGTSVWAGGLGFFGSVGYWLGLVSLPLWVPALGGIVGSVALAGAGFALVSKLRNRSVMDAATLQLHIFSTLAWADGVLDEAEKAALAALRDELIGAGAKADEVEWICFKAPKTGEEFLVRAQGFPEEQRRGSLISGWQLVLKSSGDRVQADKVFLTLCRRLNLGAAAEELKSSAESTCRQSGEQFGAAVVATRYLGREMDGDALERAISILTSLDPSGAAAKQNEDARAIATTMASAAAAIAAVATGNVKLLPIIGRAYVALYPSVRERAGDSDALRERAIRLAKHLGASEAQTGAYLDELRAPIEGQAAKAKQKAA
jgi:hypothetical protein